jgi:addiction module RelE/StbE family toxin
MTDKKQNKLIEFSPVFKKLLAQAPADIRLSFREAYGLFTENPNHPALRNHLLTDKYAGFRSIDVTEDWRAIYREKPERIKFVALGTHDKLYG